MTPLVPVRTTYLVISGVVPQRPHHVAALRQTDLHLAGRRLVEQREGVAELLDLPEGDVISLQ